MFKICCGPPTTPLPDDIAWWAPTDKAPAGVDGTLAGVDGIGNEKPEVEGVAGTPDVEVVETGIGNEKPEVEGVAGTRDVEVVESAESPNVEAVETAGTADVEGVADTCTSATAVVVEVSTSESIVDAVCGGTAEWAVEAVVKGTDCEGRSG